MSDRVASLSGKLPRPFFPFARVRRRVHVGDCRYAQGDAWPMDESEARGLLEWGELGTPCKVCRTDEKLKQLAAVRRER